MRGREVCQRVQQCKWACQGVQFKEVCQLLRPAKVQHQSHRVPREWGFLGWLKTSPTAPKRSSHTVEDVTKEMLGAMAAKRVCKSLAANIGGEEYYNNDDNAEFELSGKPKMPTDNKPTSYLAGVAYVMPKTRQWRVYLQKGSKYDFKIVVGSDRAIQA